MRHATVLIAFVVVLARAHEGMPPVRPMTLRGGASAVAPLDAELRSSSKAFKQGTALTAAIQHTLSNPALREAMASSEPKRVYPFGEKRIDGDKV